MFASLTRRACRALPRLLALEHRLTPATATLAAGVLTIDYTAGGSTSEAVTVSSDGTNISLAGDLNGTATFEAIDVAKIVVQDTGHSIAQNLVISGTVDLVFAGGFECSGVEFVTVNRRVAVTGGSELKVDAPGAVLIAASLTSEDGALFISANQQAIPTGGNFVGIDVVGSTVSTTGRGSLTLLGRGGNGSGSQHGVFIRAGASVTGGSNGAVTVIGTGGAPASGSSNVGVLVNGSSSATVAPGVISSTGAPVSVFGQGGGLGNSTQNYGVRLNGGSISAGGDGTVVVEGTGGASKGYTNFGIYINKLSTTAGAVTSNGGNVSVTGIARDSFSIAAELDSGLIASSGMGTVTVRADSLVVQSGMTIRAGANGTSTATIQPTTPDMRIQIGDIYELHTPVPAMGLANSELDRVFAKTIVIGSDGSTAYPGAGSGPITVMDRMYHASDANIVVVTRQSIAFNTHYGWWSNAGNLTFLANQQSPSTNANFTGITVTDAEINSASGTVILRGRGGNLPGPIAAIGVYLYDSSMYSGGNTVIQGSTTHIEGIGGSPATLGAVGFKSLRGYVTSNGGDVSVSGIGGDGGASQLGGNFGVHNQGYVFAPGSGAVTLSGIGGTSAGGGNDGVFYCGIGSGGPLTINATAGKGGLAFSSPGGVISAGGTNNPSNSSPLFINTHGSFLMTGNIYAGGDILFQSTGSIACSLVSTKATITVDAPGQTATITSKDTKAARLVVAPDTTVLVNGIIPYATSSVTVAGTLGGAAVVGYTTVNAGGKIAPGDTIGRLASNNIVFAPGSTLEVQLNGSKSIAEYDQLQVVGTVDLGGATLKASLGYVPGPSQTFLIVNNDGTDPVQGTFDGLAEGSTMMVDGRAMRISYAGLSGNDVTLTTAPAVTEVVLGDGTAQRSMVKQLVVTFSEPMTFTGPVADAFKLTRTGSTGDVALTASPATGPASSVTITFAGDQSEFGSLIDGFYNLTVDATKVANAFFDGDADGLPGGNYTIVGTLANKWFRLFGDIDGNGTTDLIDFTTFRTAFGAMIGQVNYNSAFDFDGDGDVDLYDLCRFRERVGATM